METPLLARQCEGVSCSNRTIPVGSGHWISDDGHIYCLLCAESPSLETISDRAGSLS